MSITGSLRVEVSPGVITMRQVPGQTIDIHLMASITWNCIYQGCGPKDSHRTCRNMSRRVNGSLPTHFRPPTPAVAAALVGDMPSGLLQVSSKGRAGAGALDSARHAPCHQAAGCPRSPAARLSPCTTSAVSRISSSSRARPLTYHHGINEVIVVREIYHF